MRGFYAYDAFNRLTTVSSTATGTPLVAAYTYDALGRRIRKVTTNGGVSATIANATYRYLYDSNQIIEELIVGGSTTTLRQFIWGQYIDELIQLKVPTTTTTPPLTAGTYCPLQDLLYRTTATANASGALVEAYDYDAYGNTLTYSGPGTDGIWFTNDDVTTLQPMCEYLFTGRQYDPETEIYWYRSRYYLPYFGRFFSTDSARNAVDLYQNCLGNSVALVDPAGLWGYAVGHPKSPITPPPRPTGLTVWMYTGYWSVDQEVYDAALERAGEFLDCWWICEKRIHSKACDALPVAEVAAIIVGSGSIRIPKGVDEPRFPGEDWTSVARKIGRVLGGEGSKAANVGKIVGRSRIAIGAKVGVVVFVYVEAGISWYCSAHC